MRKRTIESELQARMADIEYPRPHGRGNGKIRVWRQKRHNPMLENRAFGALVLCKFHPGLTRVSERRGLFGMN